MRLLPMPFRTALTTVILGCAVASSAPTFAQIAPPPLKITQTELKNGLKIVLHEDHSAPVVNLQVWYRVGSKDEKSGQDGFAHLFEHIMFKGSKNLTPGEFDKYIEGAGGFDNAYTTFDKTVYWQSVPANQLEPVMWLEAERMRSLTVDEANFVSERKVVLEEKRLGEDRPYGNLFRLVFENAFTVHPYHHTPIGSEKDLNAATVADVKAFHDRYYLPNNATLVIAGDFESAAAVKMIEKWFGDIQRGADAPQVTTREPQRNAEKRITEYDSKVPLPAVVLAFNTPEKGSQDRFALDLASNILSAGQSSRLYRSLVYDKQLAVAASGQAEHLEQHGLFFFFAILNAGKDIKDGEQNLLAEIDRLQREVVSQAELDKAKIQFIASLVNGRKSVQQKADAIGEAAVTLGDPNLVNDELKKYQAVTTGDIQRVAKTYFTPQNRLVIYMLPESLRPKQ